MKLLFSIFNVGRVFLFIDELDGNDNGNSMMANLKLIVLANQFVQFAALTEFLFDRLLSICMNVPFDKVPNTFSS